MQSKARMHRIYGLPGLYGLHVPCIRATLGYGVLFVSCTLRVENIDAALSNADLQKLMDTTDLNVAKWACSLASMDDDVSALLSTADGNWQLQKFRNLTHLIVSGHPSFGQQA